MLRHRRRNNTNITFENNNNSNKMMKLIDCPPPCPTTSNLPEITTIKYDGNIHEPTVEFCQKSTSTCTMVTRIGSCDDEVYHSSNLAKSSDLSTEEVSSLSSNTTIATVSSSQHSSSTTSEKPSSEEEESSSSSPSFDFFCGTTLGRIIFNCCLDKHHQESMVKDDDDVYYEDDDDNINTEDSLIAGTVVVVATNDNDQHFVACNDTIEESLLSGQQKPSPPYSPQGVADDIQTLATKSKKRNVQGRDEDTAATSAASVASEFCWNKAETLIAENQIEDALVWYHKCLNIRWTEETYGGGERDGDDGDEGYEDEINTDGPNALPTINTILNKISELEVSVTTHCIYSEKDNEEEANVAAEFLEECQQHKSDLQDEIDRIDDLLVEAPTFLDEILRGVTETFNGISNKDHGQTTLTPVQDDHSGNMNRDALGASTAVGEPDMARARQIVACPSRPVNADPVISNVKGTTEYRELLLVIVLSTVVLLHVVECVIPTFPLPDFITDARKLLIGARFQLGPKEGMAAVPLPSLHDIFRELEEIKMISITLPPLDIGITPPRHHGDDDDDKATTDFLENMFPWVLKEHKLSSIEAGLVGTIPTK